MIKKSFIQLVRLGIGHDAGTIPSDTDWNNIEVLANKQGLSAVIMDGLEKLSNQITPPKELLLQWIGETLNNYEYRYELYRRAIAEMAAFYNEHNIKMMILKGYACSLDWPKPEHRPCGDIDIWQFGRQKTADVFLMSEKGIRIDDSHHHHTVFYWRDIMVENHYDFVNVHGRRSNKELERVFKELAVDDSFYTELYGERIYLPSPNLHALFLIRHLVSHFASEKITLRQVLDWAFFVEKHSREVDWAWLLGILNKYHMDEFVGCLNGICIEDLGFKPEAFHLTQFDSKLKERVLQDILSPEFEGKEPRSLVGRLMFKYRRWQANAWKQRICYAESRWSTFWWGIWAHILKPSSI